MKRYHVFVGCHDTYLCSVDYLGSFVTHAEALAAKEEAARQYGLNWRWCDCTILETQADGSLRED